MCPAAAREEIVSCKKKLEDLYGAATERFCHPSGYRTACLAEAGANLSTNSSFVFNLFTACYLSRNCKRFWKIVPLIFAAT